jgi:CRISPR system Cascade subunit CasE
MYLTLIERKNDQFFQSDYERMEYARRISKRKRYLSNLSNRQTVHAMICEMAGGCKRKDEKLLFKVVGGNASRIMVQSMNQLNDKMVLDFGYVKLSQVKIDEIYNGFIRDGVVVKFKASLTPTCKSDGKIKSIQNIDERLNWVKRKFNEKGSNILDIAETEHELIQLAHRHDSMTSFYNGYSYVGTLEVTDTKKFISAVFDGIGKAKSYGAGLVVLSK